MRVNGYQCDICEKIHQSAEALNTKERLPPDWVIVARVNGSGVPEREYHFCSMSHLYQWAHNQLRGEEQTK